MEQVLYLTISAQKLANFGIFDDFRWLTAFYPLQERYVRDTFRPQVAIHDDEKIPFVVQRASLEIQKAAILLKFAKVHNNFQN